MPSDIPTDLIPDDLVLTEETPAQPRATNAFFGILQSAANAGHDPATLERLVNTGITPGTVGDWTRLRMEHEERKTGQPLQPQQATAIYNAFQKYANAPVQEAQSTAPFQPGEMGVAKATLGLPLKALASPITWLQSRLAPTVSTYSPEWGAKMTGQARQTTQLHGTKWGSIPGEMISGVITWANPISAAAYGAMDSDLDSQLANEQGADIPGYKHAARAVLSGLLNYGAAKVFQQIPGSQLSGNITKDLVRQGVPEVVALKIAPAILGGLTIGAQTGAQQAINEQPLDPTEILKQAAIGTAIPLGLETLGAGGSKLRQLVGAGENKLQQMIATRQEAQTPIAPTPVEQLRQVPQGPPGEPGTYVPTKEGLIYRPKPGERIERISDLSQEHPVRQATEQAQTRLQAKFQERNLIAAEQELRPLYDALNENKSQLQTQKDMPPEQRQVLESRVDHGAAVIQEKLGAVEAKYGENVAEDLRARLEQPTANIQGTRQEMQLRLAGGVQTPEGPPTPRGDILRRMLGQEEVPVEPIGVGAELVQRMAGAEKIASLPEYPERPITPETDIATRLRGIQATEYAEGYPTPREELAKALGPGEMKPPKIPLQARMEAKRAAITPPPEVEPLVESKVTPPPEKVNIFTRGREMLREVGSAIGSRIGLTKGGQNVADKIVEVGGKQELEQVKTEARLQPYQELGRSLSKEEGIKLVDEINTGDAISDGRFTGFRDEIVKLNAENIQRANKLGWNTTEWTGDWIGKIFEFPDESGRWPGERGYTNRLAGAENFLKTAKYKTYGEALAAVERMGGRVKYSNPVDMAAAKQIEVHNSLIAHEMFQDAINKGQVHLVTKENPVRPGEEMIDDPIRWTHDPQGKTYASPKEYADLFNWKHEETPKSRILNALVGANHAMTAMRMGLDFLHATFTTMASSGLLFEQVLRDLAGGQFARAGRVALQAIDITTPIRMGSKVQELAAKGVPVAEAIATGGGRTMRSSMFDKNDYQTMKEDWAEGNHLKAAQDLSRLTLGQFNKTLFKRLIERQTMGVNAIRAQSEIMRAQREGLSLSSDEFKSRMSSIVRETSNMIHGDNRINFQNKVMAKVGHTFFGTPGFILGKLRFTEESIRALAPLFQGKGAGPAAFGLMGALLAQAWYGTSANLLLNGKLPQSYEDMTHIPTPWKDVDGNPIRLTLRHPLEAVAAIATGDKSFRDMMINRLSPIVDFLYEMGKGSDYRGAPTRETWGDILTTARKTMQPFFVGTMERKDIPLGIRIGGAVTGFLPSAKKFSRSEAENYAIDLMRQAQAPRTKVQITHSDVLRGLISDVRQKRPEAAVNIRQALEKGDILPADLKTITERVSQPQGLQSVLKNPELSPRQLMEIWDRMTPGERKSNRFIVVGRIGRARETADFRNKDKVAALKSIQKGVQ